MRYDIKYVYGTLVEKITDTDIIDINGNKYAVATTPIVVVTASVLNSVAELSYEAFLHDVDHCLDSCVYQPEEGVTCIYVPSTGGLYGSADIEDVSMCELSTALFIKITNVATTSASALSFDMELYSTFDCMKDRVDYLVKFPIELAIDIIELEPIWVPTIGEIRIKHCADVVREVALKNATDWLKGLEESWC